jgi:hypothetical protein
MDGILHLNNHSTISKTSITKQKLKNHMHAQLFSYTLKREVSGCRSHIPLAYHNQGFKYGFKIGFYQFYKKSQKSVKSIKNQSKFKVDKNR